MDRILRLQLKQIEADEKSSATELTHLTLRALRQWIRRAPRASGKDFLAVAGELLHTQPSMGPTLRLANLAALAADSADPKSVFADSLASFRSNLESAPHTIQELFAKGCRRWKPVKIHTYSYSSTVAAALIAARSSIEWVECSESRPGLEGRRLAEELAHAGIAVHFTTDAAMLDETIHLGDLLVLGADAVMPQHLANKVGSDTLVRNFARRGQPIWVLCGTDKFRPGSPYHCESSFWADTHGGYQRLWSDPAEKVTVRSPLLECFPFHKKVRVLSERGWMTPRRVRREIAKIKLSPRLKELLD